LRAASGERIGAVDDILAATPRDAAPAGATRFLAPLDLQAIKAAGVTFAVSMLERVIEERTRGDAASAAAIRAEVAALVGGDLGALKPGSPEAMRLKQVLIEQGAWSQYLEVGIGPDAEIFTKSQPMSAIGTGADAGLHPASHWNNPEPEVVLIVSSDGAIKGATSATTSTCATSRAARRCCSARPRTITPPAPWARSSGSSTPPSRSMTCARRTCR
jgi:fumarylacetoacetate (FAA) hydrolase family protein